MNSNEIVKRLRRRPFRFFLSDGDQKVVQQPEFIAVRGRTMIIVNEPVEIDHHDAPFSIYNLLQVTRVESLPLETENSGEAGQAG